MATRTKEEHQDHQKKKRNTSAPQRQGIMFESIRKLHVHVELGGPNPPKKGQFTEEGNNIYYSDVIPLLYLQLFFQ